MSELPSGLSGGVFVSGLPSGLSGGVFVSELPSGLSGGVLVSVLSEDTFCVSESGSTTSVSEIFVIEVPFT